MEVGRGQVVRQRVLVPLFGGSNPSVPEHIHFFRYFVFSSSAGLQINEIIEVGVVYLIAYFFFFHFRKRLLFQ